jgi:hypothetical protein
MYVTPFFLLKVFASGVEWSSGFEVIDPAASQRWHGFRTETLSNFAALLL